MKLQVLAAAAVLSLSFAGVASAADRMTAALEQPVAAKIKVVAGGAVWTCEGATCSATATTSRSTTFRACADLAKEVGRVSSYGGKSLLQAEQLGKCNASAAQLPTQQQAAK
jgi:hypothetical protein